MIRQVRKDRPQQELAATKAGIEIDARRAGGGVDVQSTIAVDALAGNRAGGRIKPARAEGKLARSLEALVGHIQGHVSVQLAGHGTTRPNRAQQPLQPRHGHALEADLCMGGLIQRKRRTGMGDSLVDVDLQRVGRLVHHHGYLRVAQRGAGGTGHLHGAVEQPAHMHVALQDALQVDRHALPPHGRDVCLGGTHNEPQTTLPVLGNASLHVLHLETGHAHRLRAQGDICPRGQHCAYPQQDGETE